MKVMLGGILCMTTLCAASQWRHKLPEAMQPPLRWLDNGLDNIAQGDLNSPPTASELKAWAQSEAKGAIRHYEKAIEVLGSNQAAIRARLNARIAATTAEEQEPLVQELAKFEELYRQYRAEYQSQLDTAIEKFDERMNASAPEWYIQQ